MKGKNNGEAQVFFFRFNLVCTLIALIRTLKLYK